MRNDLTVKNKVTKASFASCVAIAALAGILNLGHLAGGWPELAAPFLAGAVIGGFILFPSDIDARIRFFIVTLYFIEIAAVQAWLPILPGPDEHAYYDQVTRQTLASLWSQFESAFTFYKGNFVSARIAFPILLESFGVKAKDVSPSLIAIPATVFWILASLSWVRALAAKDSETFGDKKIVQPIIFLFLLVLPSSVYWSSVFAKDLITSAIFIFSAVAFSNRCWFRGLLWLAVGTLLRPYAIAMILSLFVFLEPGWRKRIFCLIGAFGIMLIATKGSFISIVNAVVFAAFAFFSPNPFNSENWSLAIARGTWDVAPGLLTAGAVFVGTSFLVGVAAFAMKGRRVQKLFLSLGISILISSCVLALMSFFSLSGNGVSYGFGGLSGNTVRLKMSLWPLIITWVSLAWIAVCDRR